MRRYSLRDDQWDRIKHFLPGREGHVGGAAADNRLFVEAVVFRFRAGIPWHYLSERFGDWKIVCQRFDRRAKSGVFERIFRVLASDHDIEFMMIDAAIVRARQHSAGVRKKRRASDRSIPRRTDHQNPCPRRRPGKSHRFDAHAGTSPRSGLRRAASPARRQGRRRRSVRRQPDRTPNHAGHPTQGEPQNQEAL